MIEALDAISAQRWLRKTNTMATLRPQRRVDRRLFPSRNISAECLFAKTNVPLRIWKGTSIITRHKTHATHPQCHQHHPKLTLSSPRQTISPHVQHSERLWIRSQQYWQKSSEGRDGANGGRKSADLRAADEAAGAVVDGKLNGCCPPEIGCWHRPQRS